MTTHAPVKIVDLHTHTKYSDGEPTPREYVEELYRQIFSLQRKGIELRLISLTDHDSMNGIEPLARELRRFEAEHEVKAPLDFLPGIELTTQNRGVGKHILGYFPKISLMLGQREDIGGEHIRESLLHIDKVLGPVAKQNMWLRNDYHANRQLPIMVEHVASKRRFLSGKPCTYDLDKMMHQLTQEYREYLNDKIFTEEKEGDVIQWANPLPRKLIKKVIQDAGIADSRVLSAYTRRQDPRKYLESFYLYLNRLSERPRSTDFVINMAEADIESLRAQPDLATKYCRTPDGIRIIRKIGGIPSYAHPYEHIKRYGKDKFVRMLKKEFISAGLMAMECYHPEHSREDTAFLLELATDLKLIVTGGTDNHMKKPGEQFGIGPPPSDIRVPYSCFERLLDALPREA